jgi:hypothetical protein
MDYSHRPWRLTTTVSTEKKSVPWIEGCEEAVQEGQARWRAKDDNGGGVKKISTL